MTETTKTKEQAILAAAEQEFLAKGFDGARTTSIAAAAGVTHAMLHYYFRTKENIFERILDEKLRLMGESVLAAFGDPALPFLERIQEGLSRHFDFIAANPDLPRFIVNEVSSKPERYDMMRQKIQPIIGMLVGNVQREMDGLATSSRSSPTPSSSRLSRMSWRTGPISSPSANARISRSSCGASENTDRP